MKIAINGEIIDTCNIYKICVIERGCWERHDGKLCLCELNSTKGLYGFYIELYGKLLIGCANSDKAKTEDLRNRLIDIWSKNQSEIPQFNF